MIIPLPAFTDNYIWILNDENLDVFDCVDPGDATPVLAYAQQEQRALRAVLLTHHHPDHSAGVQELQSQFPNCVVYGPQDARIPFVTHPVHENDQVTPGAYCFNVLSIPGHTSSHICYYEAQQGWLFCGDTLFSAGCGRVFDGTLEQLYQSIERLKNLPATTLVFCGHEYTRQNLRFAKTVEPMNQNIEQYANQLDDDAKKCSLPSSIALEHDINPFFRTQIPEVIAFAAHHNTASTDALSVFRILRQVKDSFK